MSTIPEYVKGSREFDISKYTIVKSGPVLISREDFELLQRIKNDKQETSKEQ